ncbi:MAG: TlyA family RNA methyltransferase [Pseudomonadota bacterium]
MTRLDRALVERGLAPSRARAQALIAAGAVTLDGQPVSKASQTVPEEAALAVTEDPCPWVSRAGLKLDHALTVFGLRPQGLALDLGASTGGFTEVLLARGAERVHAVDVGHGQMRAALAADPRVTLHEGVNARHLPVDLCPAPDWVTADLSFISLKLGLPPALAMARAGATLVALIKPQFEAGPREVSRGGIVRDQATHRAVCEGIRDYISEAGWSPVGLTESPVLGGSGNAEFLIAARKG